MQDARPYAYVLVFIGLAAATWAALLPHYDAGFHLYTSILVGLALPFVAYFSLSERLRPGWLLATGLVITGLTLGYVIALRGLAAEPARALSAYAIPLVVAAVLLPLAYGLGKLREP
ncbi:hypothetical protein [Thiobacter aerophilum]|uniref:Uncharacterized protein n=1 Tax=Thiobacter aerophilum TaxID=3121275 RepID=A0ABV0EBE0_9BURK